MADETYSPGLEGVLAGETAISTLVGGLHYRGYSIEDLAEYATFEEVAHLLLHGELPTASELAALRGRLRQASVSGALFDVFRRIPPATSAMDVLRTAASFLAHFDPATDDNSHAANVAKAERLVAQLPIALAAWQRIKTGQEPLLPDAGLSLAANLLWMLFGRRPTAEAESALNVSLVLYAEHEYNASTFTARVVASTLSDLHSAITAAIGALKGPLHGGANERVLEVLEEVGTPEKAAAWVRAALAAKRKIMGFGHRVYRDGDPRATILRGWCQRLAAQTGRGDLEAMADTIERAVRAQKKLPPNVDWPSGRLYHYLNLPVDLYTPLFVVSRVTGWSAHVIEQLDNNRLIRPRSRYIGPAARPWTPLSSR